MAAARTGYRHATIRMLWAIAKSPELKMEDEDLYALIYRETGKESMRKMSQKEIDAVGSARTKAACRARRRCAGKSTCWRRTWAGVPPRSTALRSVCSAWSEKNG